MRTLALDPGIRGCGVALFVDDQLERAEYIRNPVAKGADLDAVKAMVIEVTACAGAVDKFAAERMQVYRQGKQKGRDPNDLIPLAAIVGGVSLCAREPTWFVPRDWKYTMPKAKTGEEYIIERRVNERLSESERLNIRDAGALSHNVYDAIGIGLFHLGRFNRRRVFPR